MRSFPTSQSILLAILLALAACQHRDEAERAPRRPPSLDVADPGVAVLAAVQNARASIAAGDRLAAFNNVTVALSNAVQLTGSDSRLFPPEAAPPGYRPPAGGGGYGGGRGGRRGGRGGGRHGGRFAAETPPSPAASPSPAPGPAGPAATSAAAPATLAPSVASRHRRRAQPGVGAGGAPTEVTSFDAQVRLMSVQAKLQTGDVAGADAELGAIAASAARHPAPADLPLVRAGQSLALASDAADAGRLGELQSQLEATRASLEAYQGAPHAKDARALAAAIGQALNNPAGLNALAPIQLSLWSGRLSSWV